MFFLSACLQLAQELRAAASGLDLIELVKRVYKVGQCPAGGETLFFLCLLCRCTLQKDTKGCFQNFPPRHHSIPDFTLAESRRSLK